MNNKVLDILTKMVVEDTRMVSIKEGVLAIPLQAVTRAIEEIKKLDNEQ